MMWDGRQVGSVVSDMGQENGQAQSDIWNAEAGGKWWPLCLVAFRIVTVGCWHLGHTSCQDSVSDASLKWEKSISGSRQSVRSLDILLCLHMRLHPCSQGDRVIPFTFQLYIHQLIEFRRAISVPPTSQYFYSYHLLSIPGTHECLQPLARTSVCLFCRFSSVLSVTAVSNKFYFIVFSLFFKTCQSVLSIWH